MGKKDRYLYQVIDGSGNVVFEGLAREVAYEYVVETKYIYHCFKHKCKMLGEFRIERKLIPDYWKPKENDKYYYVASKGIIEDYFSTKDFTRLARYNVGNCFKTREEAVEHYGDIEHKLRTYYENT